MSALNLSGAFITFFAVIGPPKVLLAFARLSRTRTVPELNRIGLLGSAVAAGVGVVVAYTARVLTKFFHVSFQALELAGGAIFFIYAVALVLGIHLGGGRPEDEGSEASHPVAEGIRELMLPFVVSPLAMTAVLVESLGKDSWTWWTTVAGAYAAVIVIDCLCVLLLSRLMKQAHTTTLEVLSRLLGLLLAAVGVELFLQGLGALGLLPPAALNRE